MVKSMLLLLYNRLKLLAMITSLSKRTRTFEGSGCGFCWQMALSLTWKNSLSCASSSELIGQSAALLNIASIKQGSGNRPVRLQVMTSINSARCKCQNKNIRLLNNFPTTYFSAFWHRAPLHLLLYLEWLPSKIPTLIAEPLHTSVPTAADGEVAWQPANSQDARLLHLKARE